MLDHMILHFRHGITDRHVVVEELSMAPGIPFGERGELLRDSVEEANDDSNWCGFHVIAELVDRGLVGHAVMAIELHLFPDSQQDGGEHEDRGPVLESVAAVHAGVEG